jgi:hypothetical protein
MMFHIRAVLLSLVTLLVIVSPSVALADATTSLELTTPATSTIATTTVGSSVTAPATSTLATTTPAYDPYNSADVEAAVRANFSDLPVMAAIAKCESSFTQFNSDGSVLNGGSGGMIGVFQINKSVHKSFALSLGDDITTLAGNMAYARYLYSQEGTTPWDSSKFCWEPDTLTANLKLGVVNKQVVALQKLLNTAGFTVALSGAGSPGFETQKFGTATRQAVQRFQCAQNIVCKGSESTTGYGLVGAKTRAALMLNS